MNVVKVQQQTSSNVSISSQHFICDCFHNPLLLSLPQSIRDQAIFLDIISFSERELHVCYIKLLLQ